MTEGALNLWIPDPGEGFSLYDQLLALQMNCVRQGTLLDGPLVWFRKALLMFLKWSVGSCIQFLILCSLDKIQCIGNVKTSALEFGSHWGQLIAFPVWKIDLNSTFCKPVIIWITSLLRDAKYFLHYTGARAMDQWNKLGGNYSVIYLWNRQSWECMEKHILLLIMQVTATWRKTAGMAQRHTENWTFRDLRTLCDKLLRN